MGEKKLVLFNLGGSLLLSADKAIMLLCKAIREAGLKPDFKIICQNWDESISGVVIPLLKNKGKWTEEQTDLVMQNCLKLFNDFNFNSPANLAAKLEELKEAGYELGIITNHRRQSFLAALVDIGLDQEIFSYVKTGDDGIKKPNPKVFDQVLKKFSPAQIVYVGNSPTDDLPASSKCQIDFMAIYSTTYPKGLFLARGISENMIYETVIDAINDLLKLKKV